MAVYGHGLITLDHFILLEKLPRSDEKLYGKKLIQGVGGPIPNALAFCGLNGEHIFFCGNTGIDLPGEMICKNWENHGFSAEFITASPDHSTAQAFILIEKRSGRRSVILQNSDQNTIVPGHFFKNVCTGDFFMCDGRYPEQQLALMKAARQHGARTILDPGARKLEIQPWQELTDYLVVSKDFILQNFGEADLFQVLPQLCQSAVKAAVVTLGAGGAMAMLDGQIQFIPPKKVESVDTTAAGDVFHGAFILGLIRGKSFYEAALFANEKAAESTLHIGGPLCASRKENV